MTPSRFRVLFGVLLCAMSLDSIAVGEFRLQILKNDMAAGNDARGITVFYKIKPLGRGNPAPAPPLRFAIKDNNGGALVDLAGDAFKTTWELVPALAQINVIGDPALPGDNKSLANLFWETKHGPTGHVDIENSNVTFWRKVGGAFNPKAVKSVEGGGIINKFGGFNRGGEDAVVSFFNEDAESITFTNIRVYKNQPLTNYTMENFLTPTGLPMNLSDVTVSPQTVSPDVSIGTVNPNTYQLLLADVHKSSEPLMVYSVGTARDLNEVAIPAVSEWGLVIVGLLTLVAGCLVIARRHLGTLPCPAR